MLGISRLHGSAATDPICVAFSSKVLRGRIESEEGVMLVVVFRDEVLRHRNRLKNPNAQSWLFTWGFTVSVLLLSNNLIFFFFLLLFLCSLQLSVDGTRHVSIFSTERRGLGAVSSARCLLAQGLLCWQQGWCLSVPGCPLAPWGLSCCLLSAGGGMKQTLPKPRGAQLPARTARSAALSPPWLLPVIKRPPSFLARFMVVLPCTDSEPSSRGLCHLLLRAPG